MPPSGIPLSAISALRRLGELRLGRAAEDITFGDLTTGAQDDLQKATQVARSMVCQYGMSDKLGHMTYGKENGMVFLGRDFGDERNYSEATAKMFRELDPRTYCKVPCLYEKRNLDMIDIVAGDSSNGAPGQVVHRNFI